MASDTEFYNGLIHLIGSRIYVSAPARVVGVNGDGTADLRPLYRENGEDWSLIMSAPSLRHVGPIEKGNVVWIVVADRPLDNMNGNQSFDPKFTGIHRLQDAVIIGVVS